MKRLLMIHLLLVAAIYGCRGWKPDSIREFIPGTYIRFSEHELGAEFDTLFITQQNKTDGEFKIIRRWKYERKIDGTLIEPEYTLTITTGFYEEKKNLIRENETGTVYTFDPDTKLLFNGFVNYQKAP